MDSFDAIVVGGGVMGTAAARELASRGRRTVVLERFSPGHANGSSGGPTRIFRYAYHRLDYVRLAVAARQAWEELEDSAGEPLLHVTGAIELGAPALVRAEILEAAGVAVERLAGDEAGERWPALRLGTDVVVVHQPDAAVVRAQQTVRAQARLAVSAGAVMTTGTVVTDIMPSDDDVRVRTDDGRAFAAPVAIVAAGAWAAPLLATAGIGIALSPTLEQSTYFDRPIDGAIADRDLPVVIDWHADTARPPYLVPDPWEPGSFKVGQHMSGRPTDPEALPREPDPARERRAVDDAARLVPGAVQSRPTDTCLYTLTADEDFVLDRVGPVVIASPCSGHGFKFAPLFGTALADLATGTATTFDRSAFRAGRPGVGLAPGPR